MLNLVIAGQNNSNNVEFELQSDGADIDVYAGDNFLGWFDLTSEGKIQFNAAYISSDVTATFARNEDGKLSVR